MATEADEQADQWLARNARALEFDDAQGTESWDRAREHGQEAFITGPAGPMGRYRVELPDGEDQHETLLVKNSDGDYAGACDCEGFRMHDKPCAHLCTLRLEEWGGQIEIATSTEYVAELTENGNGREEPEPAGAPTPPAQAGDASTITGDDAFATALPDVPDQYVMELGGDTYIRRAGYARLARSAGLRLSLVEVVGAHETGYERAKYRATVMGPDGDNLASDVGTAGPPEMEEMGDAEMHLDELAATRAATRALAWATGEGLTAVAEVKPEADR